MVSGDSNEKRLVTKKKGEKSTSGIWRRATKTCLQN